jgi:DNA-binding NtrC family response regulator
MKEGRILIADDQKGILNALQILLQKVFGETTTINNPNILLAELALKEYDLLLLDMNFKAGINSGNEGIYWLKEVKKKFPRIEVVMITAYGDIELAVKALKEGATDFVLKPWDNDKLVATLQSAYRLRQSTIEIDRLKSREGLLKSESAKSQPLIIGKSPAMQNVMTMIRKIADTEANILITGENGTGKEVIAREIHRLSSRRDELFVLVDLSSLSETLFESELFGHKKGSFTNAYDDRAGRFQMADKGTLFLDEIGNIPNNLQSKLLTVLQTRTVTPVGADKSFPVDIRLISATNRNMAHIVMTKQFREDLMYRMNTIQIHLPPLRERPEDIEELLQYYMTLYTAKYNKTGLSIAGETLEKLMKNPWPGNIRQLQHTVEKAVILADHHELKPVDFLLENVDPPTQILETIDEMEKKMIFSALKRNAGNQTVTAEQLGITRQTLYNKIKKYGL